MLPWVKKTLHPSRHVVGSDQSKGLAKAWRTMHVQAVTACHGKAHYTPVVKLKTSLIPQKALKSLRACSRAKVNRTSVTMVGGDQRCESQVASLKQMLRQCNMLGRSSSKSSRCHIDGLSSGFLTKAPGASEDSRRSDGVSELLPRQCLTEGSLGADLRLGCRGTLNTQKWARRVCWPCQHFVHFHLQNFAVP